MADSSTDFSSALGSGIWKAFPFLKNYANYKVPQFDSKGIAAPKFDPFNYGVSSSTDQNILGNWNPGAVKDVKKYYGWSPEDALRYQQAYGDMATQQAATAWRDIYQPGINQAKLYDLQLQKAGLDYRENSPTAQVQRGFIASSNLANTAGADAALSNALANQLIAAKQPGRMGYAGQTFTA
jgi:hypothetical protein